MRNTEYYFTAASNVGGRSCLTHRDNPEDRKLWGRYGFIWSAGEGRYAACVTSPLLASRLMLKLEIPKGDDGEYVYYFSEKELPEICRTLRVSRIGIEQEEAFRRFAAKEPGGPLRAQPLSA